MAKNKRTKTYTGPGTDKPEPKVKAPLLPVKISTKKAAQRVKDAKPVAIFEIDDNVYSMSSAPRAEVGLQFIELLNSEGADKAAHYLLTTTLGKKAYKALREVVGLESEDFEGVLLRVQEIVLPKGSSGTRKQRRA